MNQQASPTIGVLVSGGLDSCILLGHLLEQGDRVQPFYIRSRLVWQREELGAVKRFLRAMRSRQLARLVILDLPMADLYRDHWSVTGREAPGLGSPDHAVFLPGRNALLLVKPAVWCQQHGIGRLALGVLGSNPFGDATQEFFASFEAALNCGPDGRVRLVRPLGGMTKREVMQLGRDLPLGLTFSCVSPVGGLHCGACNKCGERRGAFAMIGAEDPTTYARPPQSPIP
jgi:7-cyano-7-deazaguanine synthase